jgi:hypothetical protein
LATGIEQIASLQRTLSDESIDRRISTYCHEFIGSPYIQNPIDDKAEKLLRFDGFDCVTFVETVLALALSESIEETQLKLRHIRYRNGNISWKNCNHFMSIDWLWNNSDLIAPNGGDNSIEIWIDRESYFSKNGHSIDSLPKREYIHLPFWRSVLSFKSTVANSAYLAFIIGNIDWLIVTHVGFLIDNGNSFSFYHASSRRGKVVIDDIEEYIEQYANGLFICKIRS